MFVATMRAAIECVADLDAVADDAAAAMSACGCEFMNSAFEAVENVALAVALDRDRFVVVVSACVACCHDAPPTFRGVFNMLLTAM